MDKVDDFSGMLFMFKFAYHVEIGILALMFVKGTAYLKRSNNTWNWLNITLMGHIIFAIVDCLLVSLFAEGWVHDCKAWARAVYAMWVLHSCMLDGVLYVRAWYINSKTKLQLVASVVLTALTGISRITDLLLTVDTFVRVPVQYGLCSSDYGWGSIFIALTGIANDLLQLYLFCMPIYAAIRRTKGVQGFTETDAYTRILMKTSIHILIAVVFQICAAVYGQKNQFFTTIVFRELTNIFHMLGAVEVQFNTHKETTGSKSSNPTRQSAASGKSNPKPAVSPTATADIESSI